MISSGLLQVRENVCTLESSFGTVIKMNLFCFNWTISSWVSGQNKFRSSCNLIFYFIYDLGPLCCCVIVGKDDADVLCFTISIYQLSDLMDLQTFPSVNGGATLSSLPKEEEQVLLHVFSKWT